MTSLPASKAELDSCRAESWECTLWVHDSRGITLRFNVLGRNATGELRRWTHDVGVSPERSAELGLPKGRTQDEFIAAVAAKWVMP